jgi:hypothetical protein
MTLNLAKDAVCTPFVHMSMADPFLYVFVAYAFFFHHAGRSSQYTQQKGQPEPQPPSLSSITNDSSIKEGRQIRKSLDGAVQPHVRHRW